MKKTEIEYKVDVVYELMKEKAKQERISQLKEFAKELEDICNELEQFYTKF